jgi:ribulose-phosphate 3-epimerase
VSPASNWLDSLPRDRLLAEVSLWSADLGRLADDMARIEPLADVYHVDVADGHFSPALLFFPDLLAAARKRTVKPFHVHLMVDDAILLDQVEQFAAAGADIISVHAENAKAEAALAAVVSRGLVAGLVLQVETPVASARAHLTRARWVTLLGTRIGVKGQDLDGRAGQRLAEARRLIAEADGRERTILAADGGIREHTVPNLRKAGADTVVMGSLAFGATDVPARAAWLRSLPRSA